MRSIGRIIAENRKKKGLSQPELAELLSQQGIDVTAKAISKWETNAREPGLHVFLTLCKLLDIEDIYDAYFGKNPYSVMDGLNQEGKDKIKDYAKILKASGLFEPVVANIIPYDLFFPDISLTTEHFLSIPTSPLRSDTHPTVHKNQPLLNNNLRLLLLSLIFVFSPYHHYAYF